MVDIKKMKMFNSLKQIKRQTKDGKIMLQNQLTMLELCRVSVCNIDPLHQKREVRSVPRLPPRSSWNSLHFLCNLNVNWQPLNVVHG